MKKIIVSAVVLVLCTSAFSQVVTIGGLNLNLSMISSELPFDGGEARMLSIKPLSGITLDVNILGLDFSPGLWIMPDLNIKNGDGENWRLAAVLGAVGYKNALIALAWNVAVEGNGFQGINQESLSIVLGFKLKTFGK